MALEDRQPSGPLDLFLGFWRGESMVIRSPLPPTQVLSALSEQVDPLFTFIGQRPTSGHIGPDGGWMRKRIGYRNSFQTILRFVVVPSGTGSRLTCQIGAPLVSRIGMVIWFVFLAAISASAIPTAFSTGKAVWALVPLVMLCGGTAVIGLGRWLARREKAFLVDLILRTIDGQVA